MAALGLCSYAGTHDEKISAVADACLDYAKTEDQVIRMIDFIVHLAKVKGHSE